MDKGQLETWHYIKGATTLFTFFVKPIYTDEFHCTFIVTNYNYKKPVSMPKSALLHSLYSC